VKTKSIQRSSTSTKKPPVDATQAILNAMDGRIERVRTGPAYQLGLLLAAIVVLVLPVVYLSLIGLVGYAVYWHAVNNAEVLGTVNGRAAILAYFGPMLAGVIVLLFMIKPLLARAVDDSVPLTLRRGQVGRYRPPASFGGPGPIVSDHLHELWMRPDGPTGHYLVGGRGGRPDDELSEPDTTARGADPERLAVEHRQLAAARHGACTRTRGPSG